MKDRTSISDYLAIFSRKGPVYKAFVHDPSQTQSDVITNVQDLNRGGIHNALEWTARFVMRLKEEFPLLNARGHLLREWGKFLGFKNDLGLDDQGYLESIISKILSIVGTLPIIKRLLPENSLTLIKEAHEMGFYLDNAYFDVPVDKVNQVSAVFTHPRCAIYVIFEDLFTVDTQLLRLIASLKIAGVGLYAGVIADDPDLGFIYLDNSFLNKDYIG